MVVNTDGNQHCTASVFDALIDHFPDAVHSVDQHGNIVYVNRTASQLLSYTEAELLAMNIRQLYPPEILDAVEKGFDEVKQVGEKRVESLFITKDGTRLPVEIRTVAIRDAGGTFLRTFSISRDLRPLKEMQDSLIHAGRLAAIGELAAGVVHDLNNPLTSVILASALVSKLIQAPDAVSPDLRKQLVAYCSTVKEAARTMEHLTTSLRDFSRGVKEKHLPVDLFDPITDALFILMHRIKNNNISVLCPVVKAKHWVFGDRNQIQQVFLNLFANALDAMSQSEQRELTVTIGEETKNNEPVWCCEVRDTGAGIPLNEQELVFKAFHTTKPRGKGTGLGLSIARSILTEHSGQITLDSVPGKGTAFFVRLPSHATPSAGG